MAIVYASSYGARMHWLLMNDCAAAGVHNLWARGSGGRLGPSQCCGSGAEETTGGADSSRRPCELLPSCSLGFMLGERMLWPKTLQGPHVAQTLSLMSVSDRTQCVLGCMRRQA